MKISSMGSFTFWAGCILTVIFTFFLIRSFYSGPKKIPDTLHLHDTYYVSFSPWLLLAPLVGALLILGSGWLMKSSDESAERIMRDFQNQGEQGESPKP